MPTSKTFKAKVAKAQDSGGCYVEIPFDPKQAFGKARAPVTATINDAHQFRTTTFTMKGLTFIPLRKSNRDAAGVEPGQTVTVTLTLDDEPRTVTPPDDLIKAMRKAKGAKAAWNALSYSHQREWAESIESAKKPETRQRRIDKCLAALTDA